MRRLDKEIWTAEESGDLGKAVTLASAAGYFVRIYDGDGESGPCAPSLVECGRYWPNEEEQENAL